MSKRPPGTYTACVGHFEPDLHFFLTFGLFDLSCEQLIFIDKGSIAFYMECTWELKIRFDECMENRNVHVAWNL